MGRVSSGALMGKECMRIEMSEIKKNIPVLDGKTSRVMSWSNGAKIVYQITREGEKVLLTLNYYKTTNNEKEYIAYEVQINSKSSNLGKGCIYYFLCPVSSSHCTILYMGYGSKYFMSRKAYLMQGLRIYYPTQLSGYYDKPNDKYWHYEKLVKEIQSKHPKTHYRGKVTKPQKRLIKLAELRDYYDKIRWHYLPPKIKALLPTYDIIL